MSIENHIENVFKRIRTRFSGQKRRSASVDISALENYEDETQPRTDKPRGSQRKVRYTVKQALSHSGSEPSKSRDPFTLHRSSNDLYTSSTEHNRFEEKQADKRTGSRSRRRKAEFAVEDAAQRVKETSSQENLPLAERLRYLRQSLRPTAREPPQKESAVRATSSEPRHGAKSQRDPAHNLQPIHTVDSRKRQPKIDDEPASKPSEHKRELVYEIPPSFSRDVVSHRPARRHHSVSIVAPQNGLHSDDFVRLDRTTHFPVNEPGYSRTPENSYRRDAYGGYLPDDDRVWNTDRKYLDKGLTQREALEHDILSHGESGYASGGGYTSGLEINIPRSGSLWSTSATDSPPSTNTDRYGRSPTLQSPRSVERLESSPAVPHRYTKKPLGSPKSLEVLDSVSPEFPRRYRSQAKSDAHLHRLQRTASERGAVQYLRSKVTETKYVTAAFEARNGLAPILEDIMKEFTHWLGARSRLLAVACEVHWSVPEKCRSRIVEIRMKDSLHRVLRDNNRRVLNLYDTCRDHLPLSFIESKIEENCAHDSQIDAFQGVYRRYYPELFALQDPTTITSHKSYWTLQNTDEDPRKALKPTPAKFLYRPSYSQLAFKSVVAVNLAMLRMEGDESDYEKS